MISSSASRARQLLEYVSQIPIRKYSETALLVPREQDFTVLIKLLKSIQKRGAVPTLSQLEDSLPLRVYHNDSNINSFEGTFV